MNQKQTFVTVQKMKFSIKDFVSKCDWIRSFRNFTFCAVSDVVAT